jgi:hypothetical protein
MQILKTARRLSGQDHQKSLGKAPPFKAHILRASGNRKPEISEWMVPAAIIAIATISSILSAVSQSHIFSRWCLLDHQLYGASDANQLPYISCENIEVAYNL